VQIRGRILPTGNDQRPTRVRPTDPATWLLPP